MTEEELTGQDDNYLDTELARVWRVNDLRAQHEEHHVDEWFDGPDGRFYSESVKFPLRDPDDGVYAPCGVSLDVTTSRRAAAEIERARDAAIAATQASSSFSATMSHEIRTPLNAVIGMTGLLLVTELDEQQRQFVETALTASALDEDRRSCADAGLDGYILKPLRLHQLAVTIAAAAAPGTAFVDPSRGDGPNG